MTKLSGTVPEDHGEKVEELIESGDYESKADFVRFATRLALSEKHGR